MSKDNMKTNFAWMSMVVFIILPVVAYFYAPLHELAGTPVLISSASVVLLCLLLMTSEKRIARNQKIIVELENRVQQKRSAA